MRCCYEHGSRGAPGMRQHVIRQLHMDIWRYYNGLGGRDVLGGRSHFKKHLIENNLMCCSGSLTTVVLRSSFLRMMEANISIKK